MDVTVRRARLSDAEAVLTFGAEVIPAHYTPILGADAAQGQLSWWASERMTAAIASGRVHLAVDEDEIIGVCETGEFDGQQVMWKLYIAPKARSRGIGVSLITRAIAALPVDAKQVILEHFAGNTRAAAFYDREGFKVVRTDAAASGDPAADVVWRSRYLMAISL